MKPNPPSTESLPAPAATDALDADDERALARYRYLLKTAPPESIEQAHAEAIARLTPAQRQLLLQQVGAMLPPYERALAGPANATPQGIARLITRAEMRQPGLAERMLGAVPTSGAGGALRLGGVLGASLLGSVIGVVVGSAIAGAVGDAIGGSTGDALPGSDESLIADGTPPDAVADSGLAAQEDADDLDLGGLFDV
ncbi:MAG: hypothetical protein MUC86_00925 [Burkholderiaceae bacterium]|jgi:phage tail tape-measure protein|nr:hypothetical protein [Burkholderiaceae bacterium]